MKKKKSQTKQYNNWNETLKGIKSRLGDTEEHISDLGNRIMEITLSKQ